MTIQSDFLTSILSPEHRAGRIRFVIFLILIFIFITCGSIISSILFPYKESSISFHLNNPSSSLANSILFELFSSYLSLFNLLGLSIFFLFIFSSVSLTREILFLLTEINRKKIKRHLLRCAFSLHEFPVFQISHPEFIHSSDFFELATLGGPAIIELSHDLAIVTKKVDKTKRTFINYSEKENLTFSIEFGEKVVDIFSLLSVSCAYPINSLQQKSSLKQIEFSYTFAKKNYGSFLNEIDPTVIQKVSDTISSKNLYEFINHLIIEELSMKIKSIIPLEEPFGLDNNEIRKNGRHELNYRNQSNTKFNLKRLFKNFSSLISAKHQIRRQTFKRNRKVGYYPFLHQSKKIESSNFKATDEMYNGTILKNEIEKAINIFFNYPCIIIEKLIFE